LAYLSPFAHYQHSTLLKSGIEFLLGNFWNYLTKVDIVLPAHRYKNHDKTP
jgi:hypothetical protein